MAKRNRATLSLSIDGIQVVKTTVYKRRLTQDQWARLGFTSVSTAKRLLNGNRVEARCLYSLLEALGLEIQDSYICKQPNAERSILIPPQETSLSLSLPGVFMTAIFAESNRSQIQRGMRHLQELLINGEITYSENKGEVTVSGDFSKDNKEHIEMTINKLERLFISYRLTW